MGHSIHKHMNSFKASNDLKYNAIDDITQGDGAGDKGSAAYMKDDMAPKMENGSAAYMDGPLEGNAFGGKMAANQAFQP